jgi:hypothetical protein
VEYDFYYTTISKAKEREESRNGIFQEDDSLEESGESENRSCEG